MKKVFASDFDGTMYFYKAPDPDKLPAANVEWIRKYQQAGHLFGLCTGRQVGGLTPFITGLVAPDFYITSTGANIIGGDHTPNTNYAAGKELNELNKAAPGGLKYAKDKHNKFQVLKCPWCGTKMVKDLIPGSKRAVGSFGYRMNKNKYFQLHCTNQDCVFKALLPIQVVDEELYSNPPTLLFGTVDKFAMMPWNGSISAFFGIGGENRAPELIIQDELHLISGPLGTIVGLYEREGIMFRSSIISFII